MSIETFPFSESGDSTDRVAEAVKELEQQGMELVKAVGAREKRVAALTEAVKAKDAEIALLRTENEDYQIGAEANRDKLTALANRLGLSGTMFKEFGFFQVKGRIAALAAENERLKVANKIHRQRCDDEYWAWQGDGQDFLESLVCPVLIQAKDLLAITKDNERLRALLQVALDARIGNHILYQTLVQEAQAILQPKDER